MKRIIAGIFIIFTFSYTFSQKDPAEHIKKGWTFGALPTISFDSDIGFQYGGLVNLYDYGDGKTYPQYLHSIYLEVSRTTKGSGINRFYYDSQHLIPGIRVTGDVSYLTEKAMDFYGFNGYNAAYHPEWEDDENEEYITRVFYRHERKLFRTSFTLQGKIRSPEWKWIGGIAYFNFSLDPVDISKLNKGQKEDELLPEVPGLYDRYLEWGVIPEKEAHGGNISYLKGGVVYDTRDNEANPMKGLWTEAVFSIAPSFLGDIEKSYSKFTFFHRQYFTLIPRKLSFAYRLGYQTTLSGDVPFYMQPHIVTSVLTSATSQGLGGSKTIRGIMRNRVVGDGIFFGNFEFRWKFYRFAAFNQNIYLALNTFVDAGKITKEIPVDVSQVPANEYPLFFNTGKDDIHMSYGAGLRIALNENFIVACDYGRAKSKDDGTSGVYISLNYLF